MKIVGLTIGVGVFEGLASDMARRNAAVFGVDWEVVRVAPVVGVREWHPSWWKLWAFDLFPEAEGIMYLDADIVARSSWPLEDLCGGFSAVRDLPYRRVHENECALYELDPACYINGGAWFCRREHAEVLERARAMGPNYGSWLEQTALNRALLDTPGALHLLPQTFNHLAHGRPDLVPRDVVCAHFCGRGGNLRAVVDDMNFWMNGEK
jgi:hypothetical protein